MDSSDNYLRSRGIVPQLFRYAFVGLVSNASGYFLYLLVTHLGVAPKLAMSILYGVGAAIGFFGNRSLTFSYKGRLIGSGIRYLMAHSAGFLLNLTILVVFVDNLGYAHEFVQAVAILVVAAFLFIAFKLFVFRVSNGNGKLFNGNI